MSARLRRLVARYGDALLGGAVMALGLTQAALDEELSGPQLAASAAGSVVLGGALAVRRRWPLLPLVAALAWVLGEPIVGESGGGEYVGVVVLVSVYTAAAHLSGRRLAVAGGLTVAVTVAVAATDPDPLNASALVFFGVLFGAPFTFGRIVHHRRARERALEDRADALDRAQEQRARVAVAEERARIARELHDVVAHAIAVVVLQARGGRRVLEEDAEQSRRAFDTIERTGEQALAELRRLLGLLRAGDDELARAPQPSLGHLDALLSEVRAAGLPAELEIEGAAVPLPPGVDLSAYRIVQEALTNALKHAGPTRARVRVRYEPDVVEVEVVDDGRGTAGANGAGHGLTGIRERVAVFGGELDAGPRRDGGYAVRARLPYADER